MIYTKEEMLNRFNKAVLHIAKSFEFELEIDKQIRELIDKYWNAWMMARGVPYEKEK